MRVLFCADSLGLGGKERQVVELLKGLSRRQDIDMSVVCMDAGEFYQPELQRLGIPVQYVLRRFRWDPSPVRAVYEIARQFRPDVIHTNGMLGSAYALPTSKWLGVPLINGSIRNAFHRRTARWMVERLLLVAADFSIANSRAGLVSRGLSTTSGKDFVVYNGFDLVRAVGWDSRSAAGPAVVGMIAEFNRYKDYRTFIEAALEVIAVRSDVVFVTVGDGETLDEMRRLVPEGCTAIKFLGRRTDVEELIQTFTIGVLATFTEGLSNSVMEYMAFAKPVVATDGGGSRELIVERETGTLVRAQDPHALAEAIAHLLDRPALARTMGHAGRQRIQNEFSLEAMVQKTVDVYSIAAQGRRRSHHIVCSDA